VAAQKIFIERVVHHFDFFRLHVKKRPTSRLGEIRRPQKFRAAWCITCRVK